MGCKSACRASIARHAFKIQLSLEKEYGLFFPIINIDVFIFPCRPGLAGAAVFIRCFVGAPGFRAGKPARRPVAPTAIPLGWPHSPRALQAGRRAGEEYTSGGDGRRAADDAQSGRWLWSDENGCQQDRCVAHAELCVGAYLFDIPAGTVDDRYVAASRIGVSGGGCGNYTFRFEPTAGGLKMDGRKRLVYLSTAVAMEKTVTRYIINVPPAGAHARQNPRGFKADAPETVDLGMPWLQPVLALAASLYNLATTMVYGRKNGMANQSRNIVGTAHCRAEDGQSDGLLIPGITKKKGKSPEFCWLFVFAPLRLPCRSAEIGSCKRAVAAPFAGSRQQRDV